jgi:hypothetical protein
MFPAAFGPGQIGSARDTLSGATISGLNTGGYSAEAHHAETTSLSSNALSDHASEDMIIRARTDITIRHDNLAIATR